MYSQLFAVFTVFLLTGTVAQSTEDSSKIVIDDKPVVIGILTQPPNGDNKATFPSSHYILQINKEFVETSGMVRAMPIHYDMPADQLYSLLDKIDGVHFTGGGLTLFNKTSQTWHPYYETARRIFQYASIPSDSFNATANRRKFLITGFCQGFELLAMLASHDNKDLLQVLKRDDVQRQVTWQWNTTDQIQRQAKMFSEFEPSLLTHMKNDLITFHYHTYGVSLQDYQQIPSLNNFFKLISTDVAENGVTYITGLQSNNFPIYALMYHPEYQLMDFESEHTFNIVRNQQTIDIFEHLGEFIYKEALRNRVHNQPLYEAEAKYREEISLENEDDLWGSVSTMEFGADILIDAYAVPSFNSTMYVLEQI